MPFKKLYILSAIPALTLMGCGIQQSPMQWSRSEALSTHAEPKAITTIGNTENKPMISEPTGDLTLTQALALALSQNPKLASVSFDRRISDALALQAGMKPNPELSVELGEFAGSGEREGLSASEFSLSISQLFERGNKRQSRIDTANLDSELADWDYRTQRLSVLIETTLAFIDVMELQSSHQLAEEMHHLSTQIFNTVDTRVNAGKATPLELNKAKIELADSKIGWIESKHALKIARQRLSVTWGKTLPQFKVAVGNLSALRDLPELISIQELITQNPSIARWATEIKQRIAVLNLERSQRTTDITINAGIQRFEENGDIAFGIGFSVPLPVRDRNQGAILSSRYQIDKAKQNQKVAVIETGLAVGETYEKLLSINSQVEILSEEILPSAKESLAAARMGYKQGKFKFLDVLDAQRTYFEMRSRHNQLLANHHRTIAVLESLIGRGLEKINPVGEVEKENKDEK